MKISLTELDEILGFSQPATLRLLNQKYFIPEDGKEWELSTNFVRFYHSLFSLVGSNDKLIEDWLASPS